MVIEFDVFLITHNHLKLTMECVDALYEYTDRRSFDFRLTVLDDSTDLTPEYFKRLSEERDNIQYLNPGRPFQNIDEMYNLGLSKTDCPYVVVLNNSCRVEKGWCGSALAIMKRNIKVGVVGFKILKWPSGVIENAGVLIYGNAIRNVGLDEPGHRYPFIYEVDAVGAGCCMFRREAIKDGFDFSYYLPFGGCEDIDYCLQLKQKGWEIIYCGYASVYHDGAATRKEGPFWEKFDENKKRFDARWKHLLDRDISYIKAMQ